MSLLNPDGSPINKTVAGSKVSPKELEDFLCVECHHDIFIPVVKFKLMPALTSGTGEAQLIPMKVFQCTSCGEIPVEFLP